MGKASGERGVRVRRLSGWSLSAAAVLAVGLIVWGLWEREMALTGMGMLGLGLCAIAWPVALGSPGPGGDADAMRELGARLESLQHAVEELRQQHALSDDARRVLNRRSERELLRKAIEEDITAEDWEAALVLVRELAESFGYRADAEEFRTRIETARHETQERRVQAAIRGLDRLVGERRWEAAEVEAARIARLYPDSREVRELQNKVAQAREAYKHDLERRFLAAAQGERVEEAMTLLREMDAYLTESEAHQFEEVARGVIGKARENLGAKFKIAVHDRRWEDAAHLGDRIIAEFPNSRMADEVRGLIDGIRAKAQPMRA